MDVVIVSGERRFRAAKEVGLASLNCVVDDSVAATRATFMEAVVSENVDRQNFDAIEEAYAVQALVTEFGSNRAVAQHFERADGWVTQRIYLTHLAPKMQDMVREKIIPLDAARLLGKQARDGNWSSEQQQEWWTQERERRRDVSAAKKAAKQAVTAAKKAAAGPPAPRTEPLQPSTKAVETRPEPPAPSSPGSAAPSFTAVKHPAPKAAEPTPEPAESRPVTVPPRRPEPTGTEQQPHETPAQEDEDEVVVILEALLQRHGLEHVVDALLKRVGEQEQRHLAELVQARVVLQLEPSQS